MQVFLVEDNRGDILLIKSTLEDLPDTDIEIIAKTNGLAAINYLTQTEKAPDLIILDLNLPLKNGFDVLSEITRRELLNKVPVIIFTSSTNESDNSKALSMGAKDYIIKPIELDEYRDVVLSFLKHVRKER